MDKKNPLLAIAAVAMGLLVIAGVAGGAFFLLVRAKMSAAPPGGSPGPRASVGYVPKWKSATRNPDGTWTLVVTLTRGTQKYDTIDVSAEVIGKVGDTWKTWAVPPAGPLHPVPPADVFDETFRTVPIEAGAGNLQLKLSIDSRYSGAFGAGNSSRSVTLEFEELPLAAERAPGK